MKPSGYEDSRPDVKRPKAGKLGSPKKGGARSGGRHSEVFASKRGSGKISWKGNKDSRPSG